MISVYGEMSRPDYSTIGVVGAGRSGSCSPSTSEEGQARQPETPLRVVPVTRYEVRVPPSVVVPVVKRRGQETDTSASRGRQSHTTRGRVVSLGSRVVAGQ